MTTESRPEPGPPRHLIDLAHRAVVVGGVATAFVAGFLIVWNAIDVLLVAFAGLLFAIFLRTLRDLVHRVTGWNETASLALVVTVLTLFVGSLGWFAVPTIARQATQLREALPKSIAAIREKLGQTPTGKWILEHSPNPDEIQLSSEMLLSRTASLMTAVVGVIGLMGVGAMALLIGLLLAVQSHLYHDGVIKLVPKQRRARVAEVLRESGLMLQWWLISKLAAMAVVGALTWVGLWFLNIELAFTLAVLTGVLTFIPNFGPILSTIPPLLLGLAQGPTVAASVLVLYILVQIIESNLVTPYLEYHTVALPPALTVLFQLALGALVGGLGLTLASPILATTIVLVRMLYIEDVLGDHENEVESNEPPSVVDTITGTPPETQGS